jgi:signal transduction histidine kinase
VRLVVTARSFGGQLELDVQDDGPGVPSHVGDKVFEPFVSSKERGTGLGLPLCLRVLSFLGGSLELRNPGEVGACFRVRLPLLEAQAAVAVEPAATAEAMA